MTCTNLTHRAAVADDAQWSSLLRPRSWVLGGDRHDMRDCPHCGTTLTRVTPGPTTLQWIPVLSLDDMRALADSVIAEVEGRAA